MQVQGRSILITSLFFFSVPALEKIKAQGNTPRTYAPTKSRAQSSPYPWHRNITSTIFWVGERATANNPRHNMASSWDTKWMENYGGYDDPNPANRARDYRPKNFIPKLNPFYIALPYNDRIDYKKTKQSAKRVIPWFSRTFKKEGQSVCDGRWVAIHYKGKICCAQWADVGPFGTDDWAYVFGGSRPKNRKNDGAGIDLSPAVRDFLGITGKDNRCDWRFAELHEIPYGPWRKFGSNNPFVNARTTPTKINKKEIEALKRAREAWLRRSGR